MVLLTCCSLFLLTNNVTVVFFFCNAIVCFGGVFFFSITEQHRNWEKGENNGTKCSGVFFPLDFVLSM